MLRPQDVLVMSDSASLVIAGNADDSVNSQGFGWAFQNQTVNGGHTYNVYEAQFSGQNVQLVVDASMQQHVS